MNNFFIFSEGINFSDSDIFKLAKNIDGLDKNITNLDKSIVKELNISSEVKTRTPENHGEWSGERGNSTWYPDGDYTPLEKSKNPERPYSNPDNLSWTEILEKYGIDGIEFKDGYPVFDEISKGNVEIDDFSDDRDSNFSQADEKLAAQKGCSPEDVAKWREENNYTWHECQDCKTMQKVPNEVHANIPHDGGVSVYKNQNK